MTSLELARKVQHIHDCAMYSELHTLNARIHNGADLDALAAELDVRVHLAMSNTPKTPMAGAVKP